MATTSPRCPDLATFLLVTVLASASIACASGQPGEDGPVSPELLSLHVEYESWVDAGGEPEEFVPSATLSVVVNDGRVLIDATALDDGERLLAELREIGLTEGSVYRTIVSGWIPIGSITSLDSLRHLRLVRPASRALGAGRRRPSP